MSTDTSSLNNQWDLTNYLISLGMSKEEAEAWIKARRKGDTFKADYSDGIGGHLDKMWRRSLEDLIQPTMSRATGQLRPIGELREQHLLSRFATLRNLVAVLWVYSFAVWVYVIAFQFSNPNSVYWPLAIWFPMRLDYFGEAGFLASFVLAIIWVKLR
jgi:hypothetical protein